MNQTIEYIKGTDNHLSLARLHSRISDYLVKTSRVLVTNQFRLYVTIKGQMMKPLCDCHVDTLVLFVLSSQTAVSSGPYRWFLGTWWGLYRSCG